MKFGSTIKQGLYAEWEQYYIDYSGLKKFLKKRAAAHSSNAASSSNVSADSGGGWDDADEAEFIKRVQEELSKVSRFQEDKVAELHGQIALYSTEVQRLVRAKQRGEDKADDEDGNGHTVNGSERTARLGDDEENVQRPGYDSDDDDVNEDDAEEIEHRFVEMEEDLEVLIADVYDLGRFTHLNYTGFIKIVKVCLVAAVGVPF